MNNTQSKASRKTTKTKSSQKTTSSTSSTSSISTEKKSPIIKKRVELDPNLIITVKNGFQGTLIYKSKKTGERFVWESFGDEQDIELSELKSAKNSYKSFFINNWFLIEDPDVIEYLGVEQYYKNALTFEEFESLFSLSSEEIEEKISRLSKGQKESIAFRARKLIANDEIDSNATIRTLEKCLSLELAERRG